MKISRVEVSVHTALALLGAILVATYILFGGPSANDGMPKRKKRKKGFVPGLINLGNTCFLNCILQSLASCTSFTSWIDHHTLHQAPPILLAALRKLLFALNNDAEENFTSAEEVLRALRTHGWVIAPEEQDAHELFHALTSTLDDEVLLIREQSNSLLNVSWVSKSNNLDIPSVDEELLKIDDDHHNSQAFLLYNKCSNIVDTNSILQNGNDCIINNYVIVDHKELPNSSKEIKKPQLSHALDNFVELSSNDLNAEDKVKIGNTNSKLKDFIEMQLVGSMNSPECEKMQKTSDELESSSKFSEERSKFNNGNFVKDNSEVVMTGLTKVSGDTKEYIGVKSESNLSIISKVPSSLNKNISLLANSKPSIMESPFKGHLASQLQCVVCGFKNAEQWSTFESLSLFMPNDFPWGHERCTLHDLLDAFVRPERVAEVTCDGCTKVKNAPSLTTFTKQLTIGKLPECLCFHIQRTVWLENNRAIKRKEFIAFPVKINMEPYTYTVSLNRQIPDSQKEVGLLGGREPFREDTRLTLSRKVLSLKRPSTFEEHESIGDFLLPNLKLQESLSAFSAKPPCSMSDRLASKEHGIYMLKAVVVHVGDIFSGHFVTYRKGPDDSNLKNKWFYTSDATVREATIDEVLRSSAYMILYERMNS